MIMTEITGYVNRVAQNSTLTILAVQTVGESIALCIIVGVKPLVLPYQGGGGLSP